MTRRAFRCRSASGRARAVANRVFEDRLGLWIIDPANLPSRLPGIRAFGGGIIRDVFLPGELAVVADMQRVRDAGLYAHLWQANGDLEARNYANSVLYNIERRKPGAVDLNIELGSDPPLPDYIREVVTLIRSQRLKYRLRINVAPWKAFALPADLLASDPNLYACEQNYEGNMDNLLSAADVQWNMDAWGVPVSKSTVCYAAACRVLGSSERVRTLPDLARLKRGVIFHDDLMAEVGLL